MAIQRLDTNLSAQNYQLGQHNTAGEQLTDQQISYTPTTLLESRCSVDERYGLPSIPQSDHRVIARLGRDEREVIDCAKIRR